MMVVPTASVAEAALCLYEEFTGDSKAFPSMRLHSNELQVLLNQFYY